MKPIKLNDSETKNKISAMFYECFLKQTEVVRELKNRVKFDQDVRLRGSNTCLPTKTTNKQV